MFVTAEKIGDLRSLDEVRNDVGHGHAAQLWHELLEKVDREMAQDAWTPKTPLQQRSEKQIKHANLLFISKIEAREPRPYGETEMQVIVGRY